MKIGIESIALVVIVGVAGCATQASVPAKSGVEQISFRPQLPPFCGRCETVNFVVRENGQLIVERGHWAGNYRNWQRRREVRQITPEQFAAFKGILEPYKPNQNTSPGEIACVNYITDNDGTLVEWLGGDGRSTRIFDFGCLDDRAMNEAVRSAPKVLAIPD